jgi:hypothetical protein
MTTPSRVLAPLSAVLLAVLAIACSTGPDVSLPETSDGPPVGGPPPSEQPPEQPPGEQPTPTPVDPSPAPAEPPPVPAPAPTPVPSPSPAVDAFGVELLRPTKTGGEQWFGTGDLRADPRFDPQNTITPNGDGSWKMTSTKVRMQVSTSEGYKPSAITTQDRNTLAARGYMQSAKDWKNVEMTGYFKLNAANDWADNIDLYARGGRHTDSSPCEGSSYKGQLTFDGKVRWAKESWHVSYDFWSYATGTSPRGRWIGFKAIQHNVESGGKTGVKLELYIDQDADGRGFQKVYETTDLGDRFGDAGYCGGAAGAMAITWGGPLAVFRWDSATDMDFKWLSVREIE